MKRMFNTNEFDDKNDENDEFQNMINEISNSIIVQIQNIQFASSKHVDDIHNISNEISNMNDDLINYVKKFKIQNEFNHRLKIKREFKIALIKIKKFQKFIFEKIIEITQSI